MKQENESLDRFLIILDWLMHLQERHADVVKYGLVHICFHDRLALGAAYGARDAAMMLADMLQQLQKSFRNTDIAARDGSDFWVLVPYTSPQTVLEKVERLVEIASEAGLSIVERDVAVFSLPDPRVLEKMRDFASVQDFLAFLKRNREITFHWSQQQNSEAA